MFKIFKLLIYILISPISWIGLSNKVIVVSGANFGFNGQAKSNYNYAINLFGAENVIFLNFSGRGFGIPLNTFAGLKYLLFSRKYITDGVLPFFISLAFKEVVQTWHGIPIKAVGTLENVERTNLLRVIVNKLLYRQWSRYTAILSPTISYSEIIKASFMGGIDKGNIYHSLLPQQLELVQLSRKSSKVNLQDEIRTVLYAPTYRDKNSRYWDLLSNKEFIRYVEEKGIKVKVKYHPLDKGSKKVESENIYYCTDDSLYDLVIESDLIITDYSSLIYDCLLISKELSLYCLDVDSYRSERGFSAEYELEKIGRVTCKSQFKDLLTNRKTYDVNFTHKKPDEVFRKIGWL